MASEKIKSYKKGIRVLGSMINKHNGVLRGMKILNKQMIIEDLPAHKIIILREFLKRMKKNEDSYKTYLDGLNKYYSDFLRQRKLGEYFIKRFFKISNEKKEIKDRYLKLKENKESLLNKKNQNIRDNLVNRKQEIKEYKEDLLNKKTQKNKEAIKKGNLKLNNNEKDSTIVNRKKKIRKPNKKKIN